MAYRRYRNEILAAFHGLPAEDKRGILAIFRRFLVKRRLSVLSPSGPARPASGSSDAPSDAGPELPGQGSQPGASGSKPRSSV